MYRINKLYQSKHFKLTEIRISGKKETAGMLCFKGSPSHHDMTGKVVCAIEDGVVISAGRCFDPKSREYRRGRIVEVIGANGVSITYGRLAGTTVAVGAKINAGDPIGIEGSSGAGTGEYLTLEFRRNGRRVDGCGLLGIDYTSPKTTWNETRASASPRLIDANELLQYARQMEGAPGSPTVVDVCHIINAPTIDAVPARREVKEVE